MSGNYYSKESAFLLLCTAAIESNCGEYIKQINGPALGIWQMEPDTHSDIWVNCDSLHGAGLDDSLIVRFLESVEVNSFNDKRVVSLILSPMYACAMARLKYSMDPNPLPKLTGVTSTDLNSFYNYYKRVYNTELGASTYDKWCTAIAANHIMKVEL